MLTPNKSIPITLNIDSNTSFCTSNPVCLFFRIASKIDLSSYKIE